MDFTTENLRVAIAALRSGKTVYTVAEEYGWDVDIIWQSARHFGYYDARGDFIMDRVP